MSIFDRIPVLPYEHPQPPSSESPPMTYRASLPGDTSGTVQGGYDVNSPSHTLPQMFREFIAQQDQDMELGYSLPVQVPPLPYPGLDELHRQPLMGMPSGSQFMLNPHMLALPYDPNFNAAYHDLESGDTGLGNGGFYAQ
jgi:hypothetical protein